MITRNTAARIAYAYDEIKAADSLLNVIEEGEKIASRQIFAMILAADATHCNSARPSERRPSIDGRFA